MQPDHAAARASHDLLPGWAAAVIYAAGFIIATRIYFATDDGEDRAEARFAAACIGLMWPLVLAVLAIGALVTLPTLGAKTKRDRREKAAMTARERHNLGTRIAELEAENDRLRKAAGES